MFSVSSGQKVLVFFVISKHLKNPPRTVLQSDIPSSLFPQIYSVVFVFEFLLGFLLLPPPEGEEDSGTASSRLLPSNNSDHNHHLQQRQGGHQVTFTSSRQSVANQEY